MRTIDRLLEYITMKKITVYAFERSCQVSNGYLKKQSKGKGAIGSHVLEKIHRKYPELNLLWLVTGKGAMINPLPSRDIESLALEEDKPYYTKDEMINYLQARVTLLEAALVDKEKIIAMLEGKLQEPKKKTTSKPK